MEGTSTPKCPHCGYEFAEEETWHPVDAIGDIHTGDCDTSKLRCPNDDCKKIFYVSCRHHIRFHPIDEEDY